MKTEIQVLFGLMISIATVSCTGGKTQSALSDAPVVATKDKVMTLDVSLLKDTVVIPLSQLVEDLSIVKLDASDEALVYPYQVEISSNYLLVKGGTGPTGGAPMPSKLFDKSGKFIADIGSIGQGPGEYTMLYSQQLDEENQRIYLMPWQSDKLLVYDLTGKSLDPIRLPYRTTKAVFKVKGNKVGVATVAFSGIQPSVAWIQNIDGTVLHEIPAGTLAVRPDFSNEIVSNQNADDFDVSFLFVQIRPDSLYHLDMDKEMLVPVFTANFGNNEVIHSYAEWKDYFLGTTTLDGWMISGAYIVDKETGRGAFFRIVNDLLNGENIEYHLFNKGYYVLNIDPESLSEEIEKSLKRESLPAYMREKLTEIQKTISPNDNNYIIYAKFK
jgi:hypothetical protein